MKKPLFITLIVVISLLIVGGIAYGGYTVREYINTLDDFEELETTKALYDIDNTDNYKNLNERVRDVSLEEERYSDYEYIYKKDNIYFLSNTDEWDEENLMLLAEELYANKHGEEIKYVASVILNDGTEDYILGTQESSITEFDIPLSMYNFLPDYDFNAKTELTEINLYQADVYQTVEDMAIVLSHEYGHHFTNYHFNLKFSYSDKETEYYKLRGEGIDNVLLYPSSYNAYLDNHMWYLVEFAAEDYVFFMGSENAHRTLDFYDTEESLNTYAYYGADALYELGGSYRLCRNGTPHENISMGLPSDIEGLEEYFYSFIDEDAPAREQRDEIGTLNLKMEKTGATEHEFTWNQPYTDDDVIYTLVLYDENDMVLSMVKTTYGDEKGVAHFGYYECNVAKGGWTYTYSYGWNVAQGTKMRARVIVTFHDGSVMLSDPLDFEY